MWYYTRRRLLSSAACNEQCEELKKKTKSMNKNGTVNCTFFMLPPPTLTQHSSTIHSNCSRFSHFEFEHFFTGETLNIECSLARWMYFCSSTGFFSVWISDAERNRDDALVRKWETIFTLNKLPLSHAQHCWRVGKVSLVEVDNFRSDSIKFFCHPQIPHSFIFSDIAPSSFVCPLQKLKMRFREKLQVIENIIFNFISVFGVF